jgi:FkbM family methyltransferase
MGSWRKALTNRARLILRALGIRAVTKTMYGGPIRVPLAYGKLRSLLFDPDYMKTYAEEDVLQFMMSRITSADIVFDVGAYQGLHTILFARVARRVAAFEPNPSTFGTLLDTLTANRASNVVAFPVAIGRETKTATLWGSGSASSLQPLIDGLEKKNVNVVTLDGFAKEQSLWPDVMKIDVEGAEYDVLSGASACLERCRLLCVELHLQQLPKFRANPQQIDELLNEAGFKEIFRSIPQREGAPDVSRLHLVYHRIAQRA